MGTTIMFSSLGYIILMLRFGMESFFSTIFFRIKVRPSNKTNLDSRNNFIFFLLGMHNIHALVLQEKLFFPPISFESKFICEIRQHALLNPFLLLLGTINMFSLSRCTIFDLWFCKKCFSSCHFP